MNDSTDPRDADPKNQPDNVARYERWGKVAAGIAAVGYVLLVLFKGEDRFGPIGDAMGPLTGVLTALALFAAIEGVRLQREELKLQRQELAESREVMRDQARAAERSAETQERLAKAQEALAEAQRKANLLAVAGHIVAVDATIATLGARAFTVPFDAGLHPNERDEILKGYEDLQSVLVSQKKYLNELQMALVGDAQIVTSGAQLVNIDPSPPASEANVEANSPQPI